MKIQSSYISTTSISTLPAPVKKKSPPFAFPKHLSPSLCRKWRALHSLEQQKQAAEFQAIETLRKIQQKEIQELQNDFEDNDIPLEELKKITDCHLAEMAISINNFEFAVKQRMQQLSQQIEQDKQQTSKTNRTTNPSCYLQLFKVYS